MPIPNEGESEKDYVSRCIPIVMNEGAKSPEHAAAKCHGMFREHKARKRFPNTYKEK